MVAGRIHKKREFWTSTLDSSQYVLSMIAHGYSLPFVVPCPPFYAKNNASSLRNRHFVQAAIAELLLTNCIAEVDVIPYCSNPLTVAESGKKLRLVLDLRHVNQYIQQYSFKYENLGTLSNIFEKGFWFGSFDLKSGYHHISVTETHQKYLGFSWHYPDGSTRYFVFLVLPFGLWSACYAFSKLLRPLVKKWRGSGTPCVVYLDDGIFGSASFARTTLICSTVLRDLQSAGFTINKDKSIFTPVQIAPWLGFIVNTVDFTFSVPQTKIVKLLKNINLALGSAKVSARTIAQIAGNIISMAKGIGPSTRFFTRKMYYFISSCTSWDFRYYLSADVKTELRFWVDNIDTVNGFAIKHTHAITKIVYSDASQHAYGGYLVGRLGNHIAHGTFTHFERNESSTYRELAAVKHVLHSLGPQLKHETVLWHSDNKNVSTVINYGSPKEQLHSLALDVYHASLKFDIRLISKWIPREDNTIADAISKYHDTDDWSIDNETFNFLEAQFGLFSIDRFATRDNTKVSRFNSRFYSPGCEDVNAFTCHWGHEFNWLCPPISLVGAAIKHLKLCAATGVLLVPEWKSSYFYPLLTPDGKQFFDFVKTYFVLDPYFINDRHTRSVFSGFTNFRTLALLLDFST